MKIQNTSPILMNGKFKKISQPTFGTNLKVVKSSSRTFFREAKIKGLSNLNSIQLIEFNEALPHFNKIAKAKYDVKIVIHPKEHSGKYSMGHLVEFFISTKTNNLPEKIKKIYNSLVKGQPKSCVLKHRFEDRLKGNPSYCWAFKTDNLMQIFNVAVNRLENVLLESDKKKRLMNFYGNKNTVPEMMRIVRDIEYGKPPTLGEVLSELGCEIDPLASDVGYVKALQKQLNSSTNLSVVKRPGENINKT